MLYILFSLQNYKKKLTYANAYAKFMIIFVFYIKYELFCTYLYPISRLERTFLISQNSS